MSKLGVEKLDDLADKFDNPNRKIKEDEAHIIECAIMKLQNALNRYRGDYNYE